MIEQFCKWCQKLLGRTLVDAPPRICDTCRRTMKSPREEEKN